MKAIIFAFLVSSISLISSEFIGTKSLSECRKFTVDKCTEESIYEVNDIP